MLCLVIHDLNFSLSRVKLRLRKLLSISNLFGTFCKIIVFFCICETVFKVTILKNNLSTLICDIIVIVDEVAEWLRRWTANPLCSARVGSNPILVDNFFFSTFPTLHSFLLYFAKQFTLSWCVLSCHSLWTCTEKQKERKLFCLSGVDRLCRDKSLLYVLGFTDAQKLLFSTKTKTSASKN